MSHEDILTRDLSSGRIHRRTWDGRTFEGDNLDAAGAFEVITAEQFAEVEPGELCERCWPPIGDPEDAA